VVALNLSLSSLEKKNCVAMSLFGRAIDAHCPNCGYRMDWKLIRGSRQV
jgi:hypothetical protein